MCWTLCLASPVGKVGRAKSHVRLRLALAIVRKYVPGGSVNPEKRVIVVGVSEETEMGTDATTLDADTPSEFVGSRRTRCRWGVGFFS